MTTGIEYAPGQKALMLEEYLGQSSEAWFATAKTSRTMRAMMVSKETSFRNEMESASYTVQDDGVTVILKGSYDDEAAACHFRLHETGRQRDFCRGFRGQGPVY